MWNLATDQTQQVAQHQAGVKEVFFIKDENKIVTGSWDRSVKYWDLRSSNPIHTHQLPERCYSMDVNIPLLVVATAGRHIQVRLAIVHTNKDSPESLPIHRCASGKLQVALPPIVVLKTIATSWFGQNESL